jgi:hypothetical protein
VLQYQKEHFLITMIVECVVRTKGGNSNLKEIQFQSKQVTVVTVYYDIVFYINAKIFFLITKQYESVWASLSKCFWHRLLN